jgi:amino acid transporter
MNRTIAMKKVTRKITTATRYNPTDLSKLEKLDTSDTFYHRMFRRDIYLHISEISVAMIGVCLTGVSILNVDQDINSINTDLDDLLAIDAFIFLISYLLSYLVFRVMTKGTRTIRRVGNIASVIFLIGMVFMVVICALTVLQWDYSLP